MYTYVFSIYCGLVLHAEKFSSIPCFSPKASFHGLLTKSLTDSKFLGWLLILEKTTDPSISIWYHVAPCSKSWYCWIITWYFVPISIGNLLQNIFWLLRPVQMWNPDSDPESWVVLISALRMYNAGIRLPYSVCVPRINVLYR